MKRKFEGCDDSKEAVKRRKASVTGEDRLSDLSHELALRVLSYLTVSDLVTCHRVSRHLKDLAEDSQLWKAHYYVRFVRPRASRIPGIKASEDSSRQLHFSSKISRWLDEEGLVRKGRQTNWKRQYKLRHNWSQGTCSVTEVAVSEQASVPPLLVQMKDSIIYMADSAGGLRAWNHSAGENMLASVQWDVIPGHDNLSPPTAIALDAASNVETLAPVAIGFADGSFSIFALDLRARKFSHIFRHPPSTNGMLSGVALSFPYLATMTASQLLSVYKFEETVDGSLDRFDADPGATLSAPKLVHSLHSHTVWPPLSLSLRPSSVKILVSIAYALPTYLSGWTVGIQELHLSLTDSTLLSSRLSSAISAPVSSPFRPSNYSIFPFTSPTRSPTTSPRHPQHANFASEIHTPPTSLSYTHPYLLVSHPDNTLTLYLVTSTDDDLHISPGKRLWGHTSSVSGTSIGQRGRAVSVSVRGDEVRVWDLEERVGVRKTGAKPSESVRVVPSPAPSGPASSSRGPGEETPGLGTSGRTSRAGAGDVDSSIGETVARFSDWYRGTEEEETSIARGWVGFDEENVVLLKERMGRGQSLVVYDFA
ncbi:F-box protein pof12 [Sphaceloma murrayae]|uniref:F-box protein pof12 n=1 Tax=Sphaceloma murrayae TaxID=2082308 RepID=A0A2K1QH70_9PEZI|nr:F-box protein pof12 [Sphaceloma murrayae]